jgi:RNA polymerase sigma-70 factor (ECF subfamily)
MEHPPPGSSTLSESYLADLRADLARAVRRICPAWLADRSDDLVQVALMRLLEIQNRSEGNAEFSTFYLQRVARSALIDEIRRRRRRQEVALDEAMVESYPSARALEPDPERAAAGRELGSAIRGCIGHLIRPRQVTVTLHLLGHSVPEAARLLGWSVKRVENLVYRGLADLRGCLELAGIAP